MRIYISAWEGACFNTANFNINKVPQGVKQEGKGEQPRGTKDDLRQENSHAGKDTGNVNDWTGEHKTSRH